MWERSREQLLQAAGHAGEDVLEPLEGAEVALAGGRLADAEDAGGFGGGEVLEVAECEDFAVEGVHGIEGLLKPDFHFGADGGLAGAGQMAEELGGEGGGGGLGEGAAVEGDF